ncbi:MAG TPA: glycosyltransferase family 4 protein [Conexibacter sp.]|nr:glycosyltransferase family 4 protein [Conexibacter sp.]
MWNTLAALRVLVVLPFPPLVEGGAASRCAIGMLRGLAAHGVDLHVLAAHLRNDPRHDVRGELPDALPVELAPIAHPSRARTRWLRFARPYGLLPTTSFGPLVRERARDADVVHFVELASASLIPLVDRPAVAQIHCLTRRDRDIRPPWTNDGRTALELLRAERRLCRRARWLLVNSQEVAAPLAAMAPEAHVAVAPLPLDPDSYAPRAPLDAPVAGLIGTAVWPPTANAVERLLRTVWPRVLERRPDARLLLAGFGMEREAFAHLPDLPGVEWRGTVPSATDFLRELGVLLYPLGRGSGAKIKVLEALALGVPVVTTPDGAEGIGDGGGLVVDVDDGALADATIALLGDDAARRAAGDAAFATFANHHAPLPATEPLLELYERMAVSDTRATTPA